MLLKPFKVLKKQSAFQSMQIFMSQSLQNNSYKLASWNSFRVKQKYFEESFEENILFSKQRNNQVIQLKKIAFSGQLPFALRNPFFLEDWTNKYEDKCLHV